MDRPEQGQTVGHFTILEPLGEGSMGSLFKARDNRLERVVALKFLSSSLLSSDAHRKQFEVEAQTASKINHPNVCTVYDVDLAVNDPYIALEFVEGRTVRELINESNAQGAPLSISRVVAVIRQIADGLAAAHNRGVIHRDLKAENVMLDTGGRIRIMDFGLAGSVGDERQFMEDALTGTLGYIAPELLQGGKPDQLSDIFSVGVLFYELLAGTLPFRGKHETALIYSVLNEDPLPIDRYRADVPPALLQLILSMLSKDREERPATMQSVLEQIALQAQGLRERPHPAPPSHDLSFPERATRASGAERGSLHKRGITRTKGHELRLYLCSTMHELGEERDHLVRKVFPEIRAICRDRGILFTEVDLRWDRSDGELETAETLHASLDEIDRCRPWIITLLGDHYGEIPEYLDVQRDERLLREYPWVEEAVLDGMSLLDIEVTYGTLMEGRESGHPLFYARSAGRSREDKPGIVGELERLGNLKERIEERGYRVTSFREPATLGEKIFEDLLDLIDREYAEKEPPSQLDQERSRHEAFSLSRRRAYIANPHYLRELNNHLNGEGPPLVLYAESGSGKSSLLAFWAEQIRRREPDCHVVEHFVGIGASSTDYYGLIRHFCMEVKERFQRTEEIPSNPADLEHQFGMWLGYADHELTQRDEKLVLILDGMNQLEGRGSDLQWIPDVVVPSVRLVISSTVESTLVELRGRGWSELGMQALTLPEREAVIVRYLSTYHKSVSDDLVARIATDHKCGHPLFLKTLLEELRLVRRAETLQEIIERSLAATGTEDLFQQVLERMEEDYSLYSVRSLLSLIAVSHEGLDERELAEISGLSRLKIGSMVAGLDYHLVRKEGYLTFFHDYLRRAVEKRYLEGEKLAGQQRTTIANYFEREVLSKHAALELLWAYKGNGVYEQLARFLSRIPVLTLLARGEMLYEVLSIWRDIRDNGIDPEVVFRRSMDEHLKEERSKSDQLESLEFVARLCENLGHWELAQEFVHRMIELAEEIGDPGGLARSAIGASILSRNIGDHREAVSQAERARDLMCEIGDRAGEADAILSLGRAYGAVGERADELASYRRVLSIREDLGLIEGVAQVLGNIGTMYSHQGAWKEALEMYEEALAIHLQTGHRANEALILGNISIVYAQTGRMSEARDLMIRAMTINQEIGNRSQIAQTEEHLGNISMSLGDFPRSIRYYESALRTAEELGERMAIASTLGNLGVVYARLGNHARATPALERSHALSIEIEDKDGIACTHGDIGFYLLWKGEYLEGLARLLKAKAMHAEMNQLMGLAYWTEGASRALLEISIEYSELPGSLQEMLPELTEPLASSESEWRDIVRDKARAFAEECKEIAVTIEDEDFQRKASLLIAHIDAMREGEESTLLLEMLSGARAEEETYEQREFIAEVLMALWRVGGDESRRAEALAAFRALHDERQEYRFETTIERLESAKSRA